MAALVGERLYRLLGNSNARPVIDNFVFRLHYGATSIALFTCAVLATSTEHFGLPIDCVSSSSPSALPRQTLTTYCWIQGTFTLDPDYDSYAAHPGVFKYVPDDDNMGRTRHSYYQWVCLMLFVQSISFYVPRYLWRLAENGLISKLAEGQSPTFALYIVSHRGCHGSLARGYHLCELLNLFVVLANFILTDLLLNGKFRDLGLYVIGGGDLSRVFPRMAKCTFNMFGPSGDVERHDSLCLLAQNVFNEKIFLAVWWWYLILATLGVLTLVYAVTMYLAPSLRRWRLASLAGSSPASAKLLHVVVSRLDYGDFFVLVLLTENLRPPHLLSLLADCCAALGDHDARSRHLGPEHRAKEEQLRLRRKLLYRQGPRDDARVLLEGYVPDIAGGHLPSTHYAGSRL